MATNIDQALVPLDLSQMSDEPAIEIEIEDPESVSINIDGLEIDLMPEEPEFDANLAEFLDEGELEKISSDLIELVEDDINSRKDWADMFVKGLEVLGMKYEERAEPWLGACGVYSPVLTEAAIRFQSEMITETFPAQGPVKTQIIGEETPENKEAAERVRDDMNYRLTDEMIEYRPEHERLLYALGLSGSAFKKVYYDPSLGRQAAPFIPAEDIIMPYGVSNIYSSGRVAHVMRKTKNDIKKLQVAGFYREVELGEPVRIFTDIEKKKAEEQGYSLTDDDRYQILEIHVDYDLPGYEDPDGVALPYVITIDLNYDDKARDAFYRLPAVSQVTGDPNRGLNGLILTVLKNGQRVFEANSPVMVWSAGPDKQIDPNSPATAGANKDNIIGWKQ